MRNTAILLGIMVASAALAGTHDPMAEERYRMKYGRYTPAEEARRAARPEVNHEAGACCRTMHGSSTSALVGSDASGQGARFAAKFGRIPPQAEARTRVVEADLAAHVMKCVEIGQCARVHTAATAAIVTSAPTDAQLRLRAKYGVTAPSQPARQERLLVASADMGGCEHECCRHGE